MKKIIFILMIVLLTISVFSKNDKNIILSARDFYHESGNYFGIKENSSDADEKFKYQQYKNADIDNDRKVTYYEYLLYMKNYLTNNILQNEIDIAKILTQVKEPLFYQSGKLKKVILLSDAKIQNIDFRAESEILFYENCNILGVKMTKVGDEVKIQGIKTKKKGEIFLYTPIGYDKSTDFDIRFYENGNLSYIRCLTHNTNIQNIECERDSSVSFYRNGKLLQARLAKDTIIQGIRCMSSELINLYDTGELESAVVSIDTEIQGYRIKSQSIIYLYKNGKIKEATLFDDKLIKLSETGQKID